MFALADRTSLFQRSVDISVAVNHPPPPPPPHTPGGRPGRKTRAFCSSANSVELFPPVPDRFPSSFEAAIHSRDISAQEITCPGVTLLPQQQQLCVWVCVWAGYDRRVFDHTCSALTSRYFYRNFKKNGRNSSKKFVAKSYERREIIRQYYNMNGGEKKNWHRTVVRLQR